MTNKESRRITHLSPCRKPASQGLAIQTTQVPSSSSKSVCFCCMFETAGGGALVCRGGADGAGGALGASAWTAADCSQELPVGGRGALDRPLIHSAP